MNLSLTKDEADLLWRFIDGGIGSASDDNFVMIMTKVRKKLVKNICKAEADKKE
jgi:hypothetical protein